MKTLLIPEIDIVSGKNCADPYIVKELTLFHKNSDADKGGLKKSANANHAFSKQHRSHRPGKRRRKSISLPLYTDIDTAGYPEIVGK